MTATCNTINGTRNSVPNGTATSPKLDPSNKNSPLTPTPSLPGYPTQSLRFLQHISSGIQSRDSNEPYIKEQPACQARLKLKVVIVGAGLGGLATAIALSRRGHSVVILEQAPQLGEV